MEGTMLQSIWRAQLDDRRIQALPIAESGSFVFVEYIYNFLRDGLLVMRKEDITKTETTKTDQFQNGHLQSSIGSVPDLNCDFSSVESWPELLDKVPLAMPVSLEEEKDGLIYMGLIATTHSEHVVIHEFLGSGRWCDELTTIHYDGLTCVQAGSGYLSTYEEILRPSPQQVAAADAASARR
jgi:hypothetical protein